MAALAAEAAAKKLQREQEQREAEERRMDELLAKVQREGMGALTEEEKRFLKRSATATATDNSLAACGVGRALLPSRTELRR